MVPVIAQIREEADVAGGDLVEYSNKRLNLSQIEDAKTEPTRLRPMKTASLLTAGEIR